MDVRVDQGFTYPQVNTQINHVDKNIVRDFDNSETKKNIPSEHVSEVTDEMLTKFEKGLDKLKEVFRGELKFEINEDADMVVVKVVDNDGEVIRQIPSEGIVKLAENLNEMLGVLFDETA